MASAPKLIQALPLPGPGVVTATAFASTTADAVLLPASLLRSSIERVLLQFAVFLNRDSANLVEACLGLQSDDFVRTDAQLGTSVRRVEAGWAKLLSATVDVTARLQREVILAPRFLARVDSGSAVYAGVTVLVLRLE